MLGSSDPASIQVHMLKLFDNVKSLEFGRNKKIVSGMVSPEQESFETRDPAVVGQRPDIERVHVERQLHGCSVEA